MYGYGGFYRRQLLRYIPYTMHALPVALWRLLPE